MKPDPISMCHHVGHIQLTITQLVHLYNDSMDVDFGIDRKTQSGCLRDDVAYATSSIPEGGVQPCGVHPN